MLDPGTESLITALLSPAIVTAVMGFILKKYLDRQEEAVKSLSGAIKELSDALGIIQVKSAVAESRSILVDELRKDIQNLRDEHTKTKCAVDAAWRVLNVKRLS